MRSVTEQDQRHRADAADRHRAGSAAFGFSHALLLVFMASSSSTCSLTGVGIWGIDIPVAWGFAITDFVWWIGIGHAGTLISAILLLLHQKWRTSINRLAEAMTIFAVMCAGLFPLLHLGRPWFFYWLLPYPNTMGLWPQFRSALVWDVFAVSTYFTVSLLFWYMGMIPDLATLRDRAADRAGADRLRHAGPGLAQLGPALAALRDRPICCWPAWPRRWSSRSIRSSAPTSPCRIVPGWHETVFPPYFVAGAIFSGFAMVLVLCIPIRHFYGLEDFITIDHLDVMGKIVLATSLLTSYGYLSEQFMSWYGGEDGRAVRVPQPPDRLRPVRRARPGSSCFCNTIAPQVLWFRGCGAASWCCSSCRCSCWSACGSSAT